MKMEEFHRFIENTRFIGIGRVVSAQFNSRKDAERCVEAMKSTNDFIKVPPTNFDEVIEFK